MKVSYARYFILILFSLLLSLGIVAQDNEEMKKEKKPKKEKKEKKPKKTHGWSYNPLPFGAYDSDLGLQLGVLMRMLKYDSTRYPMYDHMMYFEASWFMKGSGIFRFYYDSEFLIKGIRTTFDASYMPDRLFKFFGFNGYEAVYNRAWEDDNNKEEYKSRAFYRYTRQFFRVKADFQGNIIGREFRWLAGVDYYNIGTKTVDIDHLNKGKSDDKKLPDTALLYDHYVDWNIIKPEEKDGGMLTAFKLGLVYDGRNQEHFPTKGIWSEIMLISAPKVTSNMESGFTKIAITHRQYVNIAKERLVFTYRLGFQTTIAGKTPFYARSLYFYSFLTGAYNEALGGGGTIRGAQRNRVIGEGFVFGNIEFRWKAIRFNLKGERYIGFNGFFDTGLIINFVDGIEETASHINDGVSPDDPEYVNLDEYFNFGAESFHSAFGLGLYLWFNPNFIVSVDYGRTLDKQDGVSGLYIGINYLF
jgi:outer membrane protein assembly factor BamA